MKAKEWTDTKDRKCKTLGGQPVRDQDEQGGNIKQDQEQNSDEGCGEEINNRRMDEWGSEQIAKKSICAGLSV